MHHEMTREAEPDARAARRDQKRRPRMPVTGKSVLLLSRLVRDPAKRRHAPRRHRTHAGGR